MEGFITPISFEIFDWKGIRLGDEIEMLDNGLVIASGVIEDLLQIKASSGSRSLMGGGGERTAGRTTGRVVLSAGNRDPSRHGQPFLI